MSGFRKASKTNARGRIAIPGPPGAGKTMSALRIAKGMAPDGTVAVIDTEQGSSEKYADQFDFLVRVLNDFSIDSYLKAIAEARAIEADVLVIDSLSHAWEWLLEHVDKLKSTKYRNNDFRAWGEATPLQSSLVNAILRFPGHVIVTLRTKTEYAMEKDERTGKVSPVRVGLAPKQREGIEYEFDLVLTMAPNHHGTVTKSRLGHGQDEVIALPGEELGVQLREWLNGPDAPVREDPPPAQAQAPAEEDVPWEDAPAHPPLPPKRLATFRKVITGLGIKEDAQTEFARQALNWDDSLGAFQLELLTEPLAVTVLTAAKACSEGRLEWRETPDGHILVDLGGGK